MPPVLHNSPKRRIPLLASLLGRETEAKWGDQLVSGAGIPTASGWLFTFCPWVAEPPARPAPQRRRLSTRGSLRRRAGSQRFPQSSEWSWTGRGWPGTRHVPHGGQGASVSLLAPASPASLRTAHPAAAVPPQRSPPDLPASSGLSSVGNRNSLPTLKEQ